MNEQFNDINNIIARILSGEASVENILVFNSWLNDNSDNMNEFMKLKEYWEISNSSEHLLDAEFSSEKFMENLSLHTESSSIVIDSTAYRYKKRSQTLIYSLAASIALLIAVSSLFFIYNDSNENYTYVAQDGLCNFILPDGTDVTLNHDSRLSFSDSFDKKERKVYLEGEAYFDVTKNKEKKFVVEMGSTKIEVLGTKFNVSARTEDEKNIATLIEGSILFKNDKQQIKMCPNQQLVFNKSNGEINSQKVMYPDEYTAWKDRIHRYYSISLSDLATQLEQVYGKEILIKGQLQDIKVSGSFSYDENIEQVLNVMQESVKFSWKEKNNKIIIN